jgi:hypothetical protein
LAKVRGDLTLIGCWAHARRGFHEALGEIRLAAFGEKNLLFIGHPEAGERSAVIYTLLGSCSRQGINPFDYLKDLFTRLPAAKITQIREFTPAGWAQRQRTQSQQQAA